jgi:hypothetical protein
VTGRHPSGRPRAGRLARVIPNTGFRARRRLAAATALALVAGASSIAVASSSRGEPPRSSSTVLPGEEVARTLTLVTGVPISPLLAVSGLGAWRWWRAPEPARPFLPWYCRPLFWGPALGLALLFALNTTLGGLVPGLKKPMDFVEEHENRISALLASPIVLAEVARLLAPPVAAGHPPSLAAAGLVALGGGDAADLLIRIGVGAACLFAFAVVFLAFHAIQVLIALSPSVLLDLVLRAFRLGMLCAAAATAALHPYLGAAWGLALLVMCLLVAGWSFRLTVFGAFVSWEILSGRVGSADPAAAPLAAFAGRGLGAPPVRSYGRLQPTGSGGWVFRWRPWLVLPARTVPVGPGSHLALLRGALSPRLVRTGPLREQTLARFPVRFRGREEGLAQRLGAPQVLDGRVVRGLKAAWRWLRSVALGGDDPVTA